MSVVLFGMFHGLCFLPVLLSLIGPMSYKASRAKADGEENFFEQGKKTKRDEEQPTEMTGKIAPVNEKVRILPERQTC